MHRCWKASISALLAVHRFTWVDSKALELVLAIEMETDTAHTAETSVADDDGKMDVANVGKEMSAVADGWDINESVHVEKDTTNDKSLSAVDGVNGDEATEAEANIPSDTNVSIADGDSAVDGENEKNNVDTNTLHDTTVSVVDGDPGGDLEVLSKDNESQVVSGMTEEIGRCQGLISRVELNLACASEKLGNLNILMMHVAVRENDFESFVLEGENALDHNADKALEYDLLCGIYDSEVRDVEGFVTELQKEIIKVHTVMSSYQNLGEAFTVMKEKLHDSEEILGQYLGEVSEMKVQSTKFQRFLSNIWRGENCAQKSEDISEDGAILETDTKLKMQTSEQQRSILRVLEQSIAKEIDLEQKLKESKEMEQELKVRLRNSAKAVLVLEEELAAVSVRLFEAENTAEVFLCSSKDLMGRLQIGQLHLNKAVQREDELKARLQTSSDALILKEEGELKHLKEKLAAAEDRGESVEEKCKLLEDTNVKLNDELGHWKCSGLAEKSVALEKQLKETDIQLQQAVASVDASQEKQTMLYSMIKDMEDFIKSLKSKVSKAEYRAGDAEDKWIILSETNAELNDELAFLRGRIECLESSICQVEKKKATTAKEINLRTKLITDLLMRLATERECLQKQISSVLEKNSSLMRKVEDMTRVPKHDEDKEGLSSKSRISSDTGEAKGSAEKEHRNEAFMTDREMCGVEAEQDSLNSKSMLETVRTIDAGRLNFKHIIGAIFITLVAVIGVLLFQQEEFPF